MKMIETEKMALKLSNKKHWQITTNTTKYSKFQLQYLSSLITFLSDFHKFYPPQKNQHFK